MSHSFLAKRQTMDQAMLSDGPDVVIHRSSNPYGCGSEYHAWEFILHGEQVCCILVKKIPYTAKEPHAWADWMIDVQELRAQSLLSHGQLGSSGRRDGGPKAPHLGH